MKQTKINRKLSILFALLIYLAAANFTQAQTSAFTYQGRLTSNGAPADGSYSMQFTLYAAESGGEPLSFTYLEPAVQVTNGVFTVQLTFDADIYTAPSLYLEIAFRPPNSPTLVTLAPRQQITSVPTAIQAKNAATADNANRLGGVNAVNYLQTNGSGAQLTNLNAENITIGSLPDARLSPNVALRSQPNTFTGDQTVNGNFSQTGTTTDLTLTNGFLTRGTLNTGAIPATGAGIRMMFYPRKAAFRVGRADGTQWDDANIGYYSTATGYNTKAIGIGSTALGFSTTASGSYSHAIGYVTTASGDYSTALGYQAAASGNYSTAIGNLAKANSFGSTALGYDSTTSGNYSTTLGAYTTASGEYSTAMGYYASTNEMDGSFVYGDRSIGINFSAVAPNSFTMRTTGGFATVGTYGTGAIPATGAGARMMFYLNKAAFRAGYVTGTQWDDANIGEFSTALGDSTTASGLSSTAAGYYSTASGNYSTAMGYGATASGSDSTAMGSNTTASGSFSSAFGLGSTASGDCSTAMGYYASTNDKAGSFVYGDASIAAYVNATAENQFVVRASGGLRFRTSPNLSTGCDLPAGSGVFSCTSSKSVKENFASVSGRDVLRRLRSVPVNYWNYVGEQRGVRHLGAFAEDFYKAFSLGADDKSISLLDVAGVNMAATKALDEKTDDLQSQIQIQQKTIERQQRQIDTLVKLICANSPAADVCRQEEK